MSTASPQEQQPTPQAPVLELQKQPNPEKQGSQEVPPKNQDEAELLEAMKKAEGDVEAGQAAEAKIDQTVVAAEKESANKLNDVMLQAKDLAPDVADAYRDAVQGRVAEKKAAGARAKEAIKNVLSEATKALKVEEKKLGMMEQAAASGTHGAWSEQKVEEQRQKVEEAKAAVAEATSAEQIKAAPAMGQSEGPEITIIEEPEAPTPAAMGSGEAPELTIEEPKEEAVAALPLEQKQEEAAMAAGNLKSLDLETPEAAPIPLVTKKTDEAEPIPLVTKKEEAEPIPLVTKKEAAPEIPKFSREDIKKQQEEWRGHLKAIMDWRKSAEVRQASLSKTEQAYLAYSSFGEVLADAQEAYLEGEGNVLDAQEALEKVQAELAEIQEKLAAKFEERQRMYEQQNGFNKQAQDLERQSQQPDISEEKRAKIAYDLKRVRGEQAVLRSHIDDIGHEMQMLEGERDGVQEKVNVAGEKLQESKKHQEELLQEKTAAETAEAGALATYQAAEATFQKEAATAMAAATAVEASAAAVSGDGLAENAAVNAESVKEKAFEMGKDDKLHEEKITMGDLGSYAVRDSMVVGAGAMAGGAALAGGVMGAKGLAKVGERAYAGIASIFYNAADLLDDLRHWKPDTFNRWQKGFSDNIRDHGFIRGMWRGAGEVAFGSYDKRMKELDNGQKMREREEEEKKAKGGYGGGGGSYRPGSSEGYPELEKADIEAKEEKAEKQKEKFMVWAKQYGGSEEWVEKTFTFDGETIHVEGDLDFHELNLPEDPTKATSFEGVLKVDGKVILSHKQRNYQQAFADQGLAVQVEPEPEAASVDSTASSTPAATGGAATAH